MIAARRAEILLVLVFLLAGVGGLAGQQTDEATIRRYSREAEQALAEKNPDAAAAALEKLARLTPDVAEVHGNLGMVYYSQGHFRQAADAFQQALKLDSGMGNARLMLGLCYAELGRPKDAVPLLEPAFQHPPDKEIGRVIGLHLEGIYLASGHAGKAAEVAEELLRRYPDDPEILYQSSHLYGDRALEIMLRLAEVAPNSPWKRLAFGEVHESLKRYDLAIVEYQNALKMDPRLPGIHFRLGRAILLDSKSSETGRDEAMKEFQQELAIDPRNARAEYELGEIHRQRGELEAAQEHFLKAVQLRPGFEDAEIALGRTLFNRKKPREALPHLLAAVEVNPTNEVSHFLLARIYSTLGDEVNHRKEMALFNKYHVRPYAEKQGSEAERPAPLTTPETTRQTLESDAPNQP